MKKWLVPLFLFAAAEAASGQWLDVTKTCDTSATTGGTINCSFSVENLNLSVPTTSLVVTNTVPFPGGTATIVQCKVGGVPTSIIGPGQSCFGTFTETAPSCANGTFDDQLEADGHQNAPGPGPVSSTDTWSVTITGATCTPTPTNTATSTNTPTPTPTRTPTPTPTRTPVLGLSVGKSCVALPPPGPLTYSWLCTFTVTNSDTVNSVTGLGITYTVNAFGYPAPSCHQPGLGGPVVTTLGPNGSGTEQCTGQVTETLSYLSCPSTDPGAAAVDIVTASGTNTGGGSATGNASVSVMPATCTPTGGIPTNTSTPTVTGTPPTSTPTVTGTPPTNTPTPTVTPTGGFIVTFTPSRTPTQTPAFGPTWTPTPTVTPTPGLGLSVTKTCPATANPGKVARCSFTIHNLDPVKSVTNLTVLNVHPIHPVHSQFWPCGSASVTVLGPNGSPTDSCTGTLNEVMDICDSGNGCICASMNAPSHSVTDILTARAFKLGVGWITNTATKTINVTCP